MNIKEINKYFLNLIMKGQTIYYGEYDNLIGLSDSIILFLLEKDDIYIDLEKCKHTNIKSVIPDDYCYKIGFLSDDMTVVNKYKFNYIINKDMNVYCKINNKYLKFIKNYKYKILKNDGVVLFYAENNLKGLLCAVRTY